jgi:hypothetical protein
LYASTSIIKVTESRRMGHWRGEKWIQMGNLKGKDHLRQLSIDVVTLQEVLGRTNRLLSLIRHGPH